MTQFVTSQTPLRVSLSGGGTDFDAYSKKAGGAVISLAINKYIYVSLKDSSPLFGPKFHISYSENEHASSIAEIKNGIVRECLRLLEIDNPLHISTAADIPSSSGLGSSSSFTVGLLNALHAYKGEAVTASQLAKEACIVEIERLRKPIGRQDQYAAAFGGCNLITFEPSGEISVSPIPNWLDEEQIVESLVMVWTGITRSADEVLREQSDKIEKNLQVLNEIKSDCLLLMEEINLGKATSSRLAQHLDRNWNLKTELGSLITSKEINELYLKCKNSGSMGGKLLGAGAGGFFLNVVSKSHSNDFRELLSDLVQVQFKLSQTGSRILLNIKGD
jgi:D-glycero-alpha-D-manno-heptose-7-phosphate kinase